MTIFNFSQENQGSAFEANLIAMKSYESSPLSNADPGASDVCRHRRAGAGIAGARHIPVREPEGKAQGGPPRLAHVNHSCP